MSITGKIQTFSFPLEKETSKFDQDGNEVIKIISWRIKFLNSARFMPTSLSNIADNIAEGVYKIKCKDCDSFLNMKVSITIQKNISVCLVIKIIQTRLMKN